MPFFYEKTILLQSSHIFSKLIRQIRSLINGYLCLFCHDIRELEAVTFLAVSVEHHDGSEGST